MGETGDTEQTPDVRLITETGDRSHALGQDELQSAGGAVRVVLDWIEAICSRKTRGRRIEPRRSTMNSQVTIAPLKSVDFESGHGIVVAPERRCRFRRSRKACVHRAMRKPMLCPRKFGSRPVR